MYVYTHLIMMLMRLLKPEDTCRSCHNQSSRRSSHAWPRLLQVQSHSCSEITVLPVLLFLLETLRTHQSTSISPPTSSTKRICKWTFNNAGFSRRHHLEHAACSSARSQQKHHSCYPDRSTNTSNMNALNDNH